MKNKNVIKMLLMGVNLAFLFAAITVADDQPSGTDAQVIFHVA